MKVPVYLQVLAGLVLAVLILFLGAKTRNAFAERDVIGKAVRDRDLITIAGHARVSTKPDLARVDVGIFSEGESVSSVQTGNTQKMNSIVDALKKMGIKEEDIQTSNYSLQPKIDWTDGKQKITGYTLSQTVNLKVRDLNKVGEAIEKAVALGANQVNGVQFTVDDPTTLQDDARLKAIQDARTKAGALADALDLHIIRVVTFSEAGGYPVAMYDSAGGIGGFAEKAMAPNVQPGSLDVNMDVSVTFEVR